MAGAALSLPVFLSASEPYSGRDRQYLNTGAIANVREAVRALCAYVLPHRPLVFGGHPAITPLVRNIAEVVSGRHHVLMFQSHAYVRHGAEDTVVTEAHDRDGGIAEAGAAWRNLSLLRMRYEMLGYPDGGLMHPSLRRYAGKVGAVRRERLGTDRFAAGFFVGGMEGVEREFHIFRSFHPDTPVFPLASTGSAAAALAGSMIAGSRMSGLLAEETAYSLVMHELLGPLMRSPDEARDFRAEMAPGWDGPPVFGPESHLDPAGLDRPISPPPG